MNPLLKTLLFLILGFQINAQVLDTLNQEVSPQGGINALGIHYYGIDFTKQQRKLLKDVEIEFIFLIDEEGIPTLKEINGIADAEIMDCLEKRTLTVEPFNPRIKDGIAESSIYFLQLVFPTYKMTPQKYGMLLGATYNEAKLEDFEYIHKSNSRYDVVFAGLMNQHLGNPSEYLNLGVGFKTEVTFTDNRKLIYGLNMSFYGNKLKKDYPINSTREQNSSPISAMVGLTFGKWFNNFNMQAEIDIGVHNVTEKLEKNDKDFVQLNGWSPGVVVNYPLRLGKESTMYYYGSPSLLSHNLNLHFGLRYMKFSIPEASGFMMEVGVGYRMAVAKVHEYKLKESS